MAIGLGAKGAEAPELPSYPDHTNLLVVRDGEGNQRPVETPADWDVRRAHILAHFQTVAGPLPGGERRVPLDVEVLEEYNGNETFTRQKITYASEPGDRVTAWLLIPKSSEGDEGRRPAMVCLHPTSPVGKDVTLGLGERPNRNYAVELAERGYVTIAPDYPIFGERKVDAYALGYASTTMKGIWDHMRAVDLLADRPDVDPERIGAIGHSLGGHNAIFLGLFDPRIKAVVSSCGFNSFPFYFEGNLTGWSHNGYMPRLRSLYQLDLERIPFDFPELIGALAPRAFFTNAPLNDSNFEVEGVRVCIESAQPVYDLLGVPDRLVAVYPDAEHDFPPEIRAQAYTFLDQALRDTP